MMILTSKQVRELFDPWPIAFEDHVTWELSVMKMRDVKKLKCFWRSTLDKEPSGKGKRFSIATIYRRMEMDRELVERRHSYRSMAREKVFPRGILVWKGMIVDGNHRVLSLIDRGYKGHLLVATVASEKRPRKKKSSRVC